MVAAAKLAGLRVDNDEALLALLVFAKACHRRRIWEALTKMAVDAQVAGVRYSKSVPAYGLAHSTSTSPTGRPNHLRSGLCRLGKPATTRW